MKTIYNVSVLAIVMLVISGCKSAENKSNTSQSPESKDNEKIFVDTSVVQNMELLKDPDYCFEHYPEILYLVQKGYPNAAHAAFKAAYQLAESDGYFWDEVDNLVLYAFYASGNDMSSWSRLKAVEKILLYSRISGLAPMDWKSVKSNYLVNSPAPFDEALEFVRLPQGAASNMYLAGCQVFNRLEGVSYDLKYTNKSDDKKRWLNVVNDPKENIYARMCAAYFIGGTSVEARHFLEAQLNSKNLRHRYNAVTAVLWFVRKHPEKAWGIDLLLKHVASGALDDSGVTSSPRGDYPDGDRDDIMSGSWGDIICWDLGDMKCPRAVLPLINILERNPKSGAEATALGLIGDPKAIPILMKILMSEPKEFPLEVVHALGMLQVKEAVPILIERLAKQKGRINYRDSMEVEAVLEALLAIGDNRAVTPIKNLIIKQSPKSRCYSKSITTVAKRILVQLDSNEPVTELLALLKKEAEEAEQKCLMATLVNYPNDSRVTKRLSAIASESHSASVRKEAIDSMVKIGTRESLLALVDLWDEKFPNDLNAKSGWKIPPKDFTEYFHEHIHQYLEHQTGKEFPAKSPKWKEFLQTYKKRDLADQDGDEKKKVKP